MEMDKQDVLLPGQARQPQEDDAPPPTRAPKRAGILRMSRSEIEPGAVLSAFAPTLSKKKDRTVSMPGSRALDAGFGNATSPIAKRAAAHSFLLLRDEDQHDVEALTCDHAAYGARLNADRERPAKEDSPGIGGGFAWFVAGMAARLTKNQAEVSSTETDVKARKASSWLQAPSSAGTLDAEGKAVDELEQASSRSTDNTESLPSAVRAACDETAPRAESTLKRSGSTKLKQAAKTMILSRRLHRQQTNQQLWQRSRHSRQQVPWHEQIYTMDSRMRANAINFIVIASLVDICFVMLEAVGFHGCSQTCRGAGGRFDPRSVPFRGHLGASFHVIKLLFGIMTDICYVSYLAVGFRTVRTRSAIGKNGQLASTREVAICYMKGAFWLDVMSCLPTYW